MTKKDKPPSTSAARQAAIEHASRFVDQIYGETQFINAIRESFRAAQSLPEIARAFLETPSVPNESRGAIERGVRYWEDVGAIASAHEQQDHASTHRMATVGLWSGAETFVTDLGLHWLETVPDAARYLDTKVTLEPSELPEDAAAMRRFAIRKAYDGATRKPNVDAYFTPLHSRLAPLGLCPHQLDREDRKPLFELWQVRNSIVHNWGRADATLTETCPWLSLNPGDQILVSADAYKRYADAVQDFAVLVSAHIATLG